MFVAHVLWKFSFLKVEVHDRDVSYYHARASLQKSRLHAFPVKSKSAWDLDAAGLSC